MASGAALAAWTAAGFEPPSSNYASFATFNLQPVLEFDASVDEAAFFSGILPNHYGGGGLTVTILWAAATATAGNCVWTCAIEAQPPAHPIGSASFASPSTVTSACPGTAWLLVYAPIPFPSGASMDGLLANQRFRFNITRDADAGTDTMTGDALLFAVYLTET